MRRWCVGCFLVVGLILLGTARPVRAQSQVHRRWGTEDGLPQSSVLSMAVDPRGDLWLGTQEGLARFDGQHFTPLGATSGLHCSVILSVATSASGWIAVGSDGCGAFRVEDGQRHRMPEVPEDARVHELAFTPDGALWLATEDGLLSVAAGSSRWLHHEGAVTALAVGPTGQLDFAVHGRVGRVESGAVRWLDGLGPLPGREITSLARQGSDLWIATREAGLLRAGPSGRRLFTVADGLPSIDVEAVRVLDDGGVWVATANGVARFDGERFVSLQISDGPTPSRCSATARTSSSSATPAAACTCCGGPPSSGWAPARVWASRWCGRSIRMRTARSGRVARTAR
jgi:ligand-binding sensor domain-containing protein